MAETKVEIKILFTVASESEVQSHGDIATIKCAINKILRNRFCDHSRIKYSGLLEDCTND